VQDHLRRLRRKRIALGDRACGEVLELAKLSDQTGVAGRGVRRLVAHRILSGISVDRVVHGHRAVRV
jgi:hypothetical protein